MATLWPVFYIIAIFLASMGSSQNDERNLLTPILYAKLNSIRQGVKPDYSTNSTDTGNVITNYYPNKCICNELYDPVCGTDDKSYYNICQMQCYTPPNVTVSHVGNCIPY